MPTSPAPLQGQFTHTRFTLGDMLKAHNYVEIHARILRDEMLHAYSIDMLTILLSPRDIAVMLSFNNIQQTTLSCQAGERMEQTAGLHSNSTHNVDTTHNVLYR
jgi:hypothetical protein